jgi:hypothetical protein
MAGDHLSAFLSVYQSVPLLIAASEFTMKHLIVLLFFGVAFYFSSPSWSEEVPPIDYYRSSNYLLGYCREMANTAPAQAGYNKFITGAASGYCKGIVDGIVFVGTGLHELCIPKGATESQTMSVVVHYIELRPERMHENFVPLVYEALVSTWPCQERPGK